MQIEQQQTAGRKRILVVDDDEACRALYMTILKRAGFEVVSAGDGEEAVELALDTLPAAILMDIAMPKLDGRGALRRIRASAATRYVPTIAITARASISERVQLLSDGFEEVLLKPIDLFLVLDAVNRQLKRRGTSRAD